MNSKSPPRDVCQGVQRTPPPQNPRTFLELRQWVPQEVGRRGEAKSKRAGIQFVLRAPGFPDSSPSNTTWLQMTENLVSSVCTRGERKYEVGGSGDHGHWGQPSNSLAFPAWPRDGFISSKHRALIQGRRKGKKEDSSPHCSCPLFIRRGTAFPESALPQQSFAYDSRPFKNHVASPSYREIGQANTQLVQPPEGRPTKEK